jgi:hypothetical protein
MRKDFKLHKGELVLVADTEEKYPVHTHLLSGKSSWPQV